MIDILCESCVEYSFRGCAKTMDVSAFGCQSYTEIPNVDQVAWVFRHLIDNARQGGSFRRLIYDAMGFTHMAYRPLYEAGGQVITNQLSEDEETPNTPT